VLGAVIGEPAQLVHAGRERVARALELAQAEQAAAAGRPRGARRGRDVREGVRDDRRELALQVGDLPAQRHARGTLGRPAALGERAVRRCFDVVPGGGEERLARGPVRIDQLLLALGHVPSPLGRAESRSLPADSTP
jgi:hypothetical protein